MPEVGGMIKSISNDQVLVTIEDTPVAQKKL